MSSVAGYTPLWKEICENSSFQNLPYRVETDEKGKIIMSPMYARHGFFQAEITYLLKSLYSEGIIVTECAVQTSMGTKVSDVAVFSRERWKEVRQDYDVHISPEIAIEILSPSNTILEMESKKDLYFQAGTKEFWVCGLNGEIVFFNQESELSGSELIPSFPHKIEDIS